MTESMVSAGHYNALRLERDQLAARVEELEQAVSYSLDVENIPEYHDEGMGCGLEDRGITDRYEAMSYGWEKAMDRFCSELLPPGDILEVGPPQSLLIHDAELFEKAAKEWLHDGNASAIYSGKNVNYILSVRARELRNEAEGKDR
jgi:hypothetical protein